MRILFLLQVYRSFGKITHLCVLRGISLRHHLYLQFGLIVVFLMACARHSTRINRALKEWLVTTSLSRISNFLLIINQNRLSKLLFGGVSVMLVRIILSLNLVDLNIRGIFLVNALLICTLISIQFLVLAIRSFHVLNSNRR